MEIVCFATVFSVGLLRLTIGGVLSAMKVRVVVAVLLPALSKALADQRPGDVIAAGQRGARQGHGRAVTLQLQVRQIEAADRLAEGDVKRRNGTVARIGRDGGDAGGRRSRVGKSNVGSQAGPGHEA